MKRKNNYPKILWGLAKRYRKIFIVAGLIWAIWFFGVGALFGWLFFRPNIDKFPDLSPTDRILVLAPHIDDETIGAGGLIQEALARTAALRIVYITNGDNNLVSVIKEGGPKISPDEFIRLGEQRMAEGRMAAATLGLTDGNIIFLGFPDRGISSLLTKYYNPNNPYSSQGTYFSYNPYRGTYREGQTYSGSNLADDLSQIIADFRPTIIISPHFRDRHPDHRAVFQFLQKIIDETGLEAKVYSYLVHYPDFPTEGGPSDFIYPPKKLFAKTGWFSLNLSTDEENRKSAAIDDYSSQSRTFLKKFIRQNEIFETE
jgi:LmbE family N-acetylglucosaminyl deacetylase